MSDPSPPKQIQIPSTADLQSLPNADRLSQAAQAADAAANTQGLVNSLRAKASAITNPAERERLLTDAYNREIEAKGLSKKAKVLQSGTFQGGLGGLGIGAATGAGLGTVVGTLVGTVATIPTSAIGTLAGAGVGAVHGPWIRLGGGGKKKEGEKAGPEEGDEEGEMVQVPQEAIDSGAVSVDQTTGAVTANDPDALREAAAAAQSAAKLSKAADEQEGKDTPAKRKPKKLEIRSKKTGEQDQSSNNASKDRKPSSTASSTSSAAKRKPPKLEVRSKTAANKS